MGISPAAYKDRAVSSRYSARNTPSAPPAAPIATTSATTDLLSVFLSTGFLLVVSLTVFGFMYWLRGIDRWGAIICVLLYLPSFFLF